MKRSVVFLAFLFLIGLTVSIFFTVWKRQYQEPSSSENIQTPVPLDSIDGASIKLASPGSETSQNIPSENSPVVLLFGGDMMFDRYIREKAGDDRNRVFSGVRSVLQSADMVIANLEGPITLNPSRSAGSTIGSRENYIFTFDPAWAKVLFEENIRVVNIGNNHIMNFGATGISETLDALRDAKVKFFGDPLDESFRSYETNIKGIRIGFVNYNQFVEGGEEKSLADISRVRPAVDILFVYTHWGAEYLPATSEEKRLAHLFVDHGADAVIGSHPHVVQEKESYHSKTIYYSLGNFVFDQYFRPDTKQGLLVQATVYSDHTISFEDILLRMKPDGTTVLDE